MVESMLKRVTMGYVVGMPVGTLILIFLSFTTEGGALFFTDALLARTGSEAAALLVQTMLSGVIGAVGVGGTVFFDIEDWGLLKSGVAHWALYTAAFMPIGFFLGWLEGLADACVMAEVFALVDFASILVIETRYKLQVKRLNALLEESRQDTLNVRA